MNPEETPLKQIRTFQGDVAEALQKQQGSLVSIQQAEHLRTRNRLSATDTATEQPNKRKEFVVLLLGSFVLLALSVGGGWYAYNEYVRRSATPITTAPANRFISANTEANIMLAATSRDTLFQTLSDAIKGMASGELRHVVLRKGLTKETAYLFPTSEFLVALESRAPGGLVRAFDPLFMFGASGKSAFLIIKLASFENAFAGMLAWEKNMSQDIGPLFATATLLKDMPPEAVFTDLIDKNKDVRVLALGKEPVLLYSFVDNNMLIITDNIETLRTLVDRLTREKLSR
ncbi:MAG: hypothetical protein Q7R69_01180 [bacterium]|nr:hypothetical protein [bacterium]